MSKTCDEAGCCPKNCECCVSDATTAATIRATADKAIEAIEDVTAKATVALASRPKTCCKSTNCEVCDKIAKLTVVCKLWRNKMTTLVRNRIGG